MKIHSLSIILGLILLSCTRTDNSNETESKPVEFNQALVDELGKMVEVDQVAAYIPQGKQKEWSTEKWNNFKDSVFVTHKKRLEEIFDEYGYPGYDRLGEKGEQHFWLMVQHSDSFPDFQARVLEKLKIEVDKKNANGKNFGLLTDRVRLNTGEQQIYGTQVTYNPIGQAYPRDLADSAGVNKRRAEVGLEPLEEYLNMMTEMHFEMNKEYLKSQGINEPKLYKVNK